MRTRVGTRFGNKLWLQSGSSARCTLTPTNSAKNSF